MPRSFQPLAVRVAVVAIAAASVPECGSDSAKAPHRYSPPVRRGTCSRFCASVPKRTTSSATMLVTDTATDTDGSARDSSSMAIA